LTTFMKDCGQQLFSLKRETNSTPNDRVQARRRRHLIEVRLDTCSTHL